MKNLIESNSKIMFGMPVIKETRLTVEPTLIKIAAGESIEAFLSSDPHLSREQISNRADFANV